MKFFGSSRTAVFLAGALGALLSSTSVEAQGNDSAAGLGMIEEVIVTARKRDESLKDVPISISVMKGEVMESRGIIGPKDLFEATAGLSINDFTGGRKDSRLGIRGVQSDESFVTRQKISSFVDGIPISGQTGPLSMAGLRAVEVLRGPQSASFGRATFAGAINYITEDASDGFEATARVGVSQHGGRDVGVALSGPINDVFGYRLMYSDSKWDGPDEWRSASGEQLGSTSTKAFVGKLNFEFSERVGGEIMYQRLETQDRDYPAVAANPAVCNGDSTITRINMSASVRLWTTKYLDCGVDLSLLRYNPDLLGQFKAQYNPALYGNVPLATYLARTLPDGTTYEQALLRNTINNPYDTLKRDRVQGEANISFGGGTLKFLAMTSKEDSFFWADRDLSDSVGVFVVGRAGAVLDSNVVTRGEPASVKESFYEMRWLSDGSKPFRYVLSASALTYDFLDEIYLGYGAIEYGLKLPSGAPVSPLLQNLVQESANNFGFATGAQWDMTDRLTLSAEGRYQSDEVCGADPTGNGGAGFKVCQKTESFLPRISANFKATDDLSLYVQFARGNNPAATNTQLGNDNYKNSLLVAAGKIPNPADGFTYNGTDPKRVPRVTYTSENYVTYAEEILDSFEIGAKGNIGEGKGVFSVALYYMNWKDMQNRALLDWNAIDVCVNGAAPSPLTGCGSAANTRSYGWNNNLQNPYSQSATIVNAGDAKLYGLEVEGQYLLTERLAVGGNIALSRAVYGSSYCSLEALQFGNLPASIVFVTDPVLGRCALVEGNDISPVTGGGFPRFVMNANVDYLIPAQPLGFDWKVSLEGHYEGDKYIDELALMKQRGFTTASLTSEWTSESWSVRAWINNLTEEDQFQTFNNLRRYFVTNPASPAASIAGAPGAYTLIPRKPREYGLTVTYRFR